MDCRTCALAGTNSAVCGTCPAGVVREPAQATPSASFAGYVANSNEDAYLEKLWDCYQNGIARDLPEKELFIELVRDLIRQLTAPGKLRAT